MKRCALPIAALAMLGGVAPARADDALAQLRDCASMAEADRLTCLLARAAVPPARPAANDWIISQTTSPVDYARIATATTSSREHAGGSAMQLSVRCRGGRTELVIAGPGISGRGEDYLISYRVSGGQMEQVAASTAAFGAGVAVKSDPVAVLRSLPGEGEQRGGNSHVGRGLLPRQASRSKGLRENRIRSTLHGIYFPSGQPVNYARVLSARSLPLLVRQFGVLASNTVPYPNQSFQKCLNRSAESSV